MHELVRGVVKSQLDIGLKYGHVLCFRGVKGLHGVLDLLPPGAFSTSARLSMRMARGPEPVTAKVWGAGAAGRSTVDFESWPAIINFSTYRVYILKM